jgi:DNA-directed RNA polymerase subunit M/transcription elongation factor TFIIS
MHFCNYCENFLYIKLDDENKLHYHCKNCNNTVPSNETGSICITDNNYIDDDTNYKQYISKYLKYDQTLPHITNIKCPNKDCIKPKDKDEDVIFVKYDFQKMKYMYYCTFCDHFWKSE